jgi:hypothetical protein
MHRGMIGLQADDARLWTSEKAAEKSSQNHPSEPCPVKKIAGAVADIAGKLWNLPNTAVGLGLGAFGTPLGARDNALNYGGNTFLQAINPNVAAITFGNVVNYAPGFRPNDFLPTYDGTATVRLASHERAHTYQSQILGPFFIPAYVLGEIFRQPGAGGSYNPFELAADDYAKSNP